MDADPEAAAPLTPDRVARRRRWRMRMLAVIAASYVVDAAVLALYALAGAVAAAVPAWYLLAGALVCSLQFAAYRSGAGDRSDDPFLTLRFVASSVAVQLVFLAVAPQAGLVFLLVLFIIFAFASLRLRGRDLAALCGATLLGVAVVFALRAGETVLAPRTDAERWIAGVCYVLTLGRCVLVGAFGSRLRAHISGEAATLRRSKEGLEDLVAERTRELERANQELERLVAERTAEIDTLREVLPICAHCKKIRDDRGAWNQLEAYISDHLDVTFSHGICADCLKRYYPEVRPKSD